MYDRLTVTKNDVRYPQKVSDGKSLLVKAQATHSGTVNGNHRFYRPDSMQKATHTWLPFGAPKRPVIVNHKEDSEVLGRVITARYIDESFKWASEFPTIKDSLFYKTDGKKVGLFESVDWIVDNLVGQKGYTGLGYIELGLNITNPDAIAKVLRDEYLTVSVGFTTDSAICSVCHQDWAIDDRCEHSPGEMQDGKQTFLICGPKAYDEVSFVTFPADPFASVLTKEALEDSFKRLSYLGLPIANRKTVMNLSDSLFTYDITHAEETMDNYEQLIADGKFDDFLAEIKSDALTSEKAKELQASLLAWTPVEDAMKTRKRSLQSTLNAQVRKRNLDNKPTEEVVDNPEILSAISTPTVDVSFDDMTETDKEYFNDAEGIYSEIELALDSIDPTAKLSVEQKAALVTTDFCGPNSTFPVANIAMAQAAIQVVEATKLSDATKQKLINSITAKKETIKAPEPVAADSSAAIVISDKIKGFAGEKFTDSGKEILGMFTSLDTAYDASPDELQCDMRQMLSAMQSDWYADDYVIMMKGVLANRDFAVINNQDLTDKEDAVNALTDSVAVLNETIVGQKKINNTLLDTYKRSLATQIVVFKVLKGQEGFTELDAISRKEKVDSLAKRHVEYLKDTVNDILAEVKFEDNKLDNTAPELGTQVADSAHIEESEVTTLPAMTDTKHVVGNLQYLTSSERKKAQLQAAYDATKKS